MVHRSLILIIYFAFAAEYVDMIKAGIVDPVKVIRTALVDAARYSSFGVLPFL